LGGWYGNGDLVLLPNASLVVEQGGRHAWTGTISLRALELPDQAARRAAALYHATQLRLRLDFDVAYVGDLYLYLVDWDTTARRVTVTVTDGASSRSYSINSRFDNGLWLHAPIQVAAGGALRITVDRAAGTNAVLSGLFLDGAGTPPAPPPAPLYELGTQGNWVGGHGHDGFAIGGWNGTSDLVALPNATLSLEQGTRTRWTKKSTPDVRALENQSETERRASTWYHATQLRLRLTFAQPYSGQLHLYVLDWDTTARREAVTVNDGVTPPSVSQRFQRWHVDPRAHLGPGWRIR
jgi:hypothetical protein